MVVAAGIVRALEQREKGRIPLRGAVLILVVVIGLGSSLGLAVPSILWAQQTSEQGATIVVSGKVTANLGTSLQIDHLKTYPIHPQVKLKDVEGGELELEAKDLEPGFNVKIRVKEGYIDHIVVLFSK
jgi:hypothetical protein